MSYGIWKKEYIFQIINKKKKIKFLLDYLALSLDLPGWGRGEGKGPDSPWTHG
jgi:hypothetical protein